jgi:hypothetical protein
MSLHVKAYFGKNVHRFSIPTTITFSQFVESVCDIIDSSIIECYQRHKNDDIGKRLLRFKYQDDEQEWVTMDTDNEWKEALKISTRLNLLRVRVLVNETLIKRENVGITESSVLLEHQKPQIPAVDRLMQQMRQTDIFTAPSARFVQDLTIEDGSQIPVGSQIIKSWKVTNSGLIEWPSGVHLICLSNEFKMENPCFHVQIAPQCPRVGEDAIISVGLMVPNQPGKRIKNIYQLRTNEGLAFGHRMWVDVSVI